MKKLLAILLVSVMVLSLCACDAADYKKATELYDTGDYPAAMTAFAALGDYKDSADKVTSCKYFIASETLSDGDFAAARSAFEALGDYLDSVELMKECDYGIAKDAMDKGDLEEAVKGFTALEGFKDSAELLVEAEDALETGKLVGKWVSDEVDATELFMAGVAAAGDLGDSFDFGKFILKLDLEFTENGTCVIALNQEQFETAANQVIDVLKAGFTDYLTDTLTEAAAEEGLTLEQILEAYELETVDQLIEMSLEMPLDDFIDQTFSEALSDMDVLMQPENGTFKVEQGTLTLFLGTETESGSYDMASDTVTIESSDEDTFSGMYPIIFHRAG